MSQQKRMGRPTTDPKDISKLIRFSETDLQKIEFCSQRTGKNLSEVVRLGITVLYDILKEE